MRRRELFLIPWATRVGYSQSGAGESKPREYVTATASRDTVPRVGLIPSTFKGNTEMDGRKIRALARPAALAAPLTADQLDDMLRLAVELGGGRRGGLVTAIQRDDWVLLKIQATGMVTDPRLVESVLRYLAEKGLGKRFTIGDDTVEAAAPTGGNFEGLTYRAAVDRMARRYPALRYELMEFRTAPALEMPVEGRVFSKRNPGGVYRVPRALRECDKVIALAPLGAEHSLLGYLGFCGAQRLGSEEERGEAALDLFSFHPADYSIVGGTFAPVPGGRHNLIIAANNAPAVDSVASAVLGNDPTKLRYLEQAVQHGYGVNDAYAIWTRGAEIEDVKVNPVTG